MKILISLILAIFTLSAYATESVDCGNEIYWIQIHRNISSDDYAGFTLHESGEVVYFKSVNITKNTFNPNERKLNFAAEIYSGPITDIGLNAKGNNGTLMINTKPYTVTCDWGIYNLD